MNWTLFPERSRRVHQRPRRCPPRRWPPLAFSLRTSALSASLRRPLVLLPSLRSLIPDESSGHSSLPIASSRIPALTFNFQLLTVNPFAFKTLRIALPATPFFSQPSALPGVGGTGLLRFSRITSHESQVTSFLPFAHSLSPRIATLPFFPTPCALFLQIPGGRGQLWLTGTGYLNASAISLRSRSSMSKWELSFDV